MNMPNQPDKELEDRLASRLLDVLIRAGLIFAMIMLCYQIFSPFISLMLWALILAVTLYPFHQTLANKMGGKQGLAATLIVIAGVVLLVGPTAVVMSSLGDSVQTLISDVQNNSLEIPPPSPGVENLPLVGKKLHGSWSKAHDDLPALIKSSQPKIGDIAKTALAFVASIGGGLLMFIASFVVAGIIMAFGETGARTMRAIFGRIVGSQRGDEFTDLSTATIRAVAQGVIGVAFIQAIIVGLVLFVAGIPWTGVLVLIVLVLGIAQVPAVIVTIPAIAYLWMSGNYSTVAAIVYTVALLISGMADNVLKPLMLGRGVDAPMPVILLGALGGMAASGILGMFLGATLLAVGYQIFMSWVATNPDTPRAQAKAKSQPPR